MDVLTDVLDTVRVKSLVSGRFEFTAPWGLRKQGGETFASFLVVTRGACWLDVEGEDGPIQMASGDFVLMPRGQAYAVRDHPDTPVLPADEVLQKCPRAGGCQPGGIFRHGGGGALTTMVGGCFQIEDGDRSPLVAALPSVIYVAAEPGTTSQWLEATLQFVSAEMAAGYPGAETVVSRLADILFVQAIRAHLMRDGARAGGWLRALIDPQIGQALAAMHQQPGAPWTVESLAARVNMSRSAFAGRFAHLVGEPPLTYLTRWRMTKASRLLRAGRATVGEVAGQVGYEAEAAFSKAFKRWSGAPPGAFRRSHGGTSPTV